MKPQLVIDVFRLKLQVAPTVKKIGHISKIQPNLDKMMWKEAWEAKAVT